MRKTYCEGCQSLHEEVAELRARLARETRPDPWAAVREAAEPLRVLLASDNSHSGDMVKFEMTALSAIIDGDRKPRARKALRDLTYWLGLMPEDFRVQADPLMEALRRALDRVEDGR